jgi:hypothetical protein
MKGVHDSRSAVRWLEGQIISYLYGGIDANGLTRSIQRIGSAYNVQPQNIKSLLESVEKNHTVYYGGRYRLAYGAIGRRFGEASFREETNRAALIQSLRNISQTVGRHR